MLSTFQEISAHELFTIAGTPVNVTTLFVSLFIAVLSFFFAWLAEKGTMRSLKARGVQDEGSAAATARLVYYVVLCVGLAVAINTFGINLTALFAAGAFVAVALGFAMRNITENFVSGIILLVERTIKPNDIIEVEGRMVKVTKLGMRATVVRTWDSQDFIIPNFVLVSNTVMNYTLRDRLHRIRTTVGVVYSSDMRKVREVLTTVANEQSWRSQAEEPKIFMKEFGDSSVNWEVSVWIDDAFGRAARHSQLNEAIWFALKDAGITIAFPQLDLHLDEPSLEAIRQRD